MYSRRMAVSVLAVVGVMAIISCEGSGDRKLYDSSARRSAAGAQVGGAHAPQATVPTADLAAAAKVEDNAPGEAEIRLPAHSDSSSQIAQTVIQPAMLIRTGTASIRVDSLEIGVERVRVLARSIGGYLANSVEETGEDRQRTATLELKLPAARWDDAVTGLKPIGKLESVSAQTQDVGEEFVDVSARVANSRRLEARLVELLATRTGKLADVLSVERELSRVREEIERYEGHLRYLRTRAAISTLTITVHEKLPVVGEHGSGSVLAESFAAAWRNFINFVAGLIAALGWLLPLGVILAIVAYLLRRNGLHPRRLFNRPTAPPTTTAPEP